MLPRSPLKDEAVVSPAFLEVLQAKKTEQIDFATALEEIDECACKLKESPVYGNLLRYKKMVRVLLLFLIEETYHVLEQSCYDPQGRRRLFLLVERIDGQLEQLTQDFLKEQLDRLELVSRLDEIRGLLLDLYS